MEHHVAFPRKHAMKGDGERGVSRQSPGGDVGAPRAQESRVSVHLVAFGVPREGRCPNGAHARRTQP